MSSPRSNEYKGVLIEHSKIQRKRKCLTRYTEKGDHLTTSDSECESSMLTVHLTSEVFIYIVHLLSYDVITA